MPQRQYVSVMGATRFNVGLSAIIQIAPGPYTAAANFKIIAGGGTLELVSSPPALTGASAAGWGLGYPIAGTEVFSVQGPAEYFFAATGATMTVAMSLGYSSGATTL